MLLRRARRKLADELTKEMRMTCNSMRNNQALGQTSIIVSGRGRKGRGFPPFLHRRIMAAVREEVQRSAQPKWAIFNWARLALAGEYGFALFFAITPVAPTPEERAACQSGMDRDRRPQRPAGGQPDFDKVLNEWMTQPYHSSSWTPSGRTENALDFTLRRSDQDRPAIGPLGWGRILQLRQHLLPVVHRLNCEPIQLIPKRECLI